ncbi:MAG: IPTL-CTERM sorting domain-containing protein [Betaproteobacteria bacterium]|nr:IPTL-CTERM sorting domain-containing protein [Betaproteobacteria bacterium]
MRNLLAAIALVATGATAQVSTDITGSADLGASVPTLSPGASDTWNLLNSGIYLKDAVTLPTGLPGLSLNGNGSVLTLTDNADYGRFLASNPGPFTLNLSDITLAGGHQPTAKTDGGAIAVVNTNSVSTLTINTSGSVVLTGNSAANRGGAIWADQNLTISGDGRGGEIVLTGNRAGASGGAIASAHDVLIGDAASKVTLSDNDADHTIVGTSGGAIAAGNTTIHGSEIIISGNSTEQAGGAIESDNITIGNDDGSTGKIEITNNKSYDNVGGALRALNGFATITGQKITISGNTSALYGGAIWSNKMGDGVVAVQIDGNEITLDDNHGAANQGGAIYSRGDVLISGSTIKLTNNTTDAGGGAIMAFGAAGTNVAVSIDGSDIEISGNSTTNGGGAAICVIGELTLSGAATVTNNKASDTEDDFGGAIYTSGDVTLNATGGNFTFSGNAAYSHANAIWLGNEKGNATATLNTATGNTITFFDPIASTPVNGLVHTVVTGSGVVVFDGARYSNPADRWSKVYGVNEIQSGTIFAVQNNTVYSVLAADVGQAAPTSFAVASGATLVGGGASSGSNADGEVRADDFTLNGTLDISGRATLGATSATASDSYSKFAITAANAHFNDGNEVLINTELNDASTQRSDVLTVNLDNGGAITGTAKVKVSNTGGPGQPTLGDGILVIQVTPASAIVPDSAFVLDNSPLSAGSSQYTLVRGEGANVNNWYLQAKGGGVGGGVGAPPSAVAPVPTLGNVALVLLALLMGGAAAVVMIRQRGMSKT